MSMLRFHPVELVNDTDLGMLVEWEGRTFWLPKSICILEGDELRVPEWLAYDKEMI